MKTKTLCTLRISKALKEQIIEMKNRHAISAESIVNDAIENYFVELKNVQKENRIDELKKICFDLELCKIKNYLYQKYVLFFLEKFSKNYELKHQKIFGEEFESFYKSFLISMSKSGTEAFFKNSNYENDRVNYQVMIKNLLLEKLKIVTKEKNCSLNLLIENAIFNKFYGCNEVELFEKNLKRINEFRNFSFELFEKLFLLSKSSNENEKDNQKYIAEVTANINENGYKNKEFEFVTKIQKELG